MKKFLFGLIFLMGTIGLNAQQIFTMSGTVTDSLGAPVPNHPVFISSDTTNIFWVYTNIVSTDANGFYADTIVPQIATGNMHVGTIDCYGNILAQSSSYTPNTQNITNNFNIGCALSGGGGGGGSGSCAALFSYSTSPIGGYAFTGSASGGVAPYTYHWDFGDGSFSTLQNPNHVYNFPGFFLPCLTITDATGCVATYCDTLSNGSGGGGSCSVYFTNTPTALGNTVSFNATTSGTGPFTYVWDFGDSTIATTTSGNTSHTYATAGAYFACVIVTDANGCTSTFCDLVIVGGSSGCTSSYSYANNPNGSISFAAAGTGTAPLGYFWDFGDGNVDFTSNPTHFYSQPGVYMVCLDVYDATQCFSTYCDTVVVSGNGGGCSAFFTHTCVGNSIGFNPTVTGTAPYTYFWDFGDSTTSTQQSPNHVYSAQGQYYACLTITDANGCTSTYCEWIYFFPTGGGGNCQTIFTHNMTATGAITFSATGTGVMPVTYDWDFGDGSFGTGATPTHTYANGTYYACVTATFGDSCVAMFCDFIVVGNGGGNPFGDISGIVLTDTMGFTVPYAKVYLIEHDTAFGTLTAIDSQMTTQGFYHFTNVPTGDYLIKAALDASDPDYANYMPTYFNSSLYWSGGTTVSVSQNNLFLIYPILMIQGNNVGTGPGFIGGLISQGANFGPGDPMPNVDVLIFDHNMNPLTHTVSDANGMYSFDNLPLGTYHLYVEVMGVVAYHHQITIDAQNPSNTSFDFDVNTYDVVASLRELNNITAFNIAPNPAKESTTLNIEIKESASIEVNVVNMIGQKVMSENLNLTPGQHNVNLDLSNFASGLYIINLNTEEGMASFKLLKE